MKNELNEEQSQKINKILNDKGHRAEPEDSELSSSIEDWNRFVDNCVKGYSLTMSDYMMHLESRDRIQDVLGFIQDNKVLVDVILSEIEKSDSGFKRLLVETEIHFIGENIKKEYPKETHWWHWGIVNNAKQKLLEGLIGEGKFEYYKKGGQKIKKDDTLEHPKDKEPWIKNAKKYLSDIYNEYF